MLALRRCIRSGVIRDERRFVSTNHPTNQPDRQRAVALMPALVAPGASPQWCVGLQGLAGALRAVRDGRRGAAVGDSPVRREVTLA